MDGNADGVSVASPLRAVQAWSLLRRLFRQPTIYVCCVLSLLAAALQAVPTQSLFLLYLKAQQKAAHYTQAQVNSMPLGAHALGIVVELGAALVLDAYGLRVATGLVLCALQVVVAGLLLAPGHATAARFAAFYLAATAYSVNPLMYGWANVVAARGGDDAARSVILAAMAAAGFILWTFWGIVFYPAGDAPYWRNGCIVLLCVAFVLAGWLFVVRWVCESLGSIPLFYSFSPHNHPSPLFSLPFLPPYACLYVYV